MKPKYKNKKFKNEEAFMDWLKKTATRKIIFQDDGQDFLAWWIDNRGEVLHCVPFQSSIWNGTMVKVPEIKIGEFLPLQNDEVITHFVKEIILLTP